MCMHTANSWYKDKTPRPHSTLYNMAYIAEATLINLITSLYTVLENLTHSTLKNWAIQYHVDTVHVRQRSGWLSEAADTIIILR
jgi:hypothetical protein